MARSVPSLLDQIEVGALDGHAPLADVLRKCVALGGRAASAELRDWARRELDGYGDGAVELPAYRMVRAAVCIDGADLAKMVRGQQLSRWEIPEFARETITDEAPIPYGVAELEKLAASSDTLHLQHPGMPDLITYMNSQAPYGTSYQSMYWAVAPTSIHGILDIIRTNLVALVAEMRAVGVEDLPSAEAANQAVNVVINGAKRSPITINTNQASGPDPGVSQTITSTPSGTETSRMPAWIRGPWGFAVGAATIVAGITGTAVWLDWSPFG
ncbi:MULTISPECIES: hypothetical protein [Nocardioides]|uniref:AbiTii domain-containing protein n=2 Tax=Nocardioides TaxID=1839 RepID=A0A4P7U9X8_9ACTN|nr:MULTISPECIES: hypothetical protein [Nocardioides]MDN4172202.1 hypothetical protein [Nocardioides oceani]QCC76095.1 hypothetical protein E2C04_00785 [Nocardioides daphniae]GGD10215.1 hypothetical protein GCM10007231_06290 [Nocardioides daphniae]|tara:strand:+ start:2428 stop:3240 length:813 start_codon:yes stop_codon:yes gene_type:complete